ncbi:LacI family transcriptional regulator [Marivirga tractuosa]|uniref:Transcriptional regulator, LacI family n=1 Tax=Marivirga tractuosa (strain ATCC 23168 / DSM 4126 / NBRC 15989 / NCIMB 1408 / VKM B-1430 / H-43) TaxID=643867 RepID=E4TRY5_MARTH|nr:LacI family DNA-binding transcriptional regulator [Marivirga tractuosa]ADR20736.1 transcriptional regulator, LacI family [Marivirga tractuosa DSM 4126]BDD14813.1 LacI family transcriptional regulator [Marivirga tractuosa]
MKKANITIKDIAKELGVSPSTVSRALKDHPDISSNTKKQINDLAQKLNYQPNTVALSLRQSKTNTLGVIIPEIAHFFFSAVISGIEDIAHDAGYHVIITQSNESFEREVMNTKALFNSRVDGILMSVSRETENYDHLQSLLDYDIPLVFFDRIIDSLNACKVIVNDEQGAYEATTHLIEQGCYRIAHLAGPQNLAISKNRLNGYKAALADNRYMIDDNLIKVCGLGTFEEAESITNEILDYRFPPDAIFANNDVAAYGAMMAIRKKKLRIPEDIAIVGFSNWRFSSLIQPALSSVTQPGFKMGQEATRLLMKQINKADDEESITETISLKTNLVVRESSKKI